MSITHFDRRAKLNQKNGRNFGKCFVSPSDENTNVIPRNYTKRQISNPHLEEKESGRIRLFNPAEHARIKGVPEKLVSGVSDTKAHEILGQSVLYNHSKGIGEMVGKYLNAVKRA